MRLDARLFALITTGLLAAACALPSDPVPDRSVGPIAAELVAAGEGDCATCVLGPLTLTRANASPRTERFTFTADPAADYIIDIDDLGSQGADGSVILNGQVLMGPRLVGETGPRHIRTAITLAAENILDARLSGKPGSSLRVEVLRDPDTAVYTSYCTSVDESANSYYYYLLVFGPLAPGETIRACADVTVRTSPTAAGGTRVRVELRNRQGSLLSDNRPASSIVRFELLMRDTHCIPRSAAMPIAYLSGDWSMDIDGAVQTVGAVPGARGVFVGGLFIASCEVFDGAGAFFGPTGIVGCSAQLPGIQLAAYFQTCAPQGYGGAVTFEATGSQPFSASDVMVSVFWVLGANQFAQSEVGCIIDPNDYSSTSAVRCVHRP